MNLELVENKNKKPLMHKIAGGFLIFIFFILIWLTYSFEFKENRLINFSTVKQKIIENYLFEAGIDNLNINYIERGKYSIIHFDDNFNKTVNDYLQDPFLLHEENCYAKRYSGNNEGIVVKNINLEKLFLNYKHLTGQNIVQFLNHEILVNNFSSKQEKNLIAIFNNSNDGIISVKSDKVDYLFKADIKDKNNLKENLDNFEKVISYILASFYPEDRELVLPDDTTVDEIVIDLEKFPFEDYGEGIRYIKDENLNFELAYKLESDKILFSNNLNGFNSIIPEFKKCSDEGVIIIPKYLVENVGILKEEEFKKYQEFIFIENQGRTSLILR
jgi:hypothetical protein